MEKVLSNLLDYSW